jgi:2,4-dienoyl-CoA reductase-like NADH-dependent reductase (Old Yellow Enzyme family)
MPRLTDPITLGAIHARNRMIMAPMTRGRATREGVPTPVMQDYYVQRASAGLIITEATGITQAGLGWPYAPGLWSAEQVTRWRDVVRGVHDAGGRIVAQLWHMGRVVHPDLGRGQPVSASPIAAPGQAFVWEGKKGHVVPRALDVAEIPGLLDDYARAATNAMEAGFDGVQLHAANGYLIDQFLRDGSNRRTDAYGGSIDNRIRLLGEVSDRLVAAIGGDRVGVRLSPNGAIQGVNDSDPHALFPAAAKRLDEAGIAWLEMREPLPTSNFGKPDTHPVHPAIRKAFSRPLILNSDYDARTGQAALDSGEADGIAFGRVFLANPDLPRRLKQSLPLNTPNVPTFYTRGEEGYTDYPVWTG